MFDRQHVTLLAEPLFSMDMCKYACHLTFATAQMYHKASKAACVATTHAKKRNAQAMPFDNHNRSLVRMQSEAHYTCLHRVGFAGNVPADSELSSLHWNIK